jgi:hypothetical protein
MFCLYKGFVNDDSVKFTDDLEPEKQNRYGEDFPIRVAQKEKDPWLRQRLLEVRGLSPVE